MPAAFETQDTKELSSHEGSQKAERTPVWSKKNKLFEVNVEMQWEKPGKQVHSLHKYFLSAFMSQALL